jgi:hypothetical protein
MNVLRINKTIPAPTIVPTKATVNSGIPVISPTVFIRVGTKLTAIITATIAVTKPVI